MLKRFVIYCMFVVTLAGSGCRSARVRQLTYGSGNDSEAVWSPDGGKILFQSDQADKLKIYSLDLARGRVTLVAGGEGHACYPAWAPDGGVVYSYGDHSMTAVEAANAGADCGYGLRLLQQGRTRILSQGYWRDYTPSVSGDGRHIYYSSTQGTAEGQSGVWKEVVAIRRLPLSGEGDSEQVVTFDSDTSAAVQPSVSPDGKMLLWAEMKGFRSNWRLCGARLAETHKSVYLTPAKMSAYAPRWSPDGQHVAFTGFAPGDPGWGIYLMHAVSGALQRVETGGGNSRSPAWSPDGKRLVYENNSSGLYKLYSVRLRDGEFPYGEVESGRVEPSVVVAQLRDGEGVRELRGVSGSMVKGVPDAMGRVKFEKPEGMAFGRDTFFVRMTVKLNKHESGIRVAAVGQYAEHPLGWQVIVRENGLLGFCPRDTAGNFTQALSQKPLSEGATYRVLGVRESSGMISLYLDGVLQSTVMAEPFNYGEVLSISLGRQWAGGMQLNGRVEEFECGRGWPEEVAVPMTREELFSQ